jgi:hypothetical protein
MNKVNEIIDFVISNKFFLSIFGNFYQLKSDFYEQSGQPGFMAVHSLLFRPFSFKLGTYFWIWVFSVLKTMYILKSNLTSSVN